MGSRRRNLIVLGLVVVLMVLSAWVVATKPTQQGLDLQGGTELVYQARPTPANPTIDADDMDRAIDIIRERVDTLGVAEPEISRIGTDQLSIGLPNVQNAQDAIDQVGQTSQLAFYDFEPNLITESKGGQGDERPFNRLYDAVKAAQQEEPECFEKDGEPLCTHEGQYYLFDENTLELLAGPADVEQDLFLPFEGDRQPEGDGHREDPAGIRRPARGGARGQPGHGDRRGGDRASRLVPAARPAGADRRRHPQPGTAVGPDDQPAERHLRLHRRGPPGLPGGDPQDRPARPGEGGRPGRRGAGFGPVGQLRRGPRRRDRLAPDHQLRREPGRDRRPHRRPDLRQLHDQARRRTWPSSCGSARCRSSSS